MLNQIDLDDMPDLSHEYGITRLVIVCRDPMWVHAYWEVAPYTWDKLKKDASFRTPCRALLKLKAVKGCYTAKFDEEIDLRSRNWYVRLPHGFERLRAELGLVMPDGKYVRVAESNEAYIPGGHFAQARND